MFQPVDKSPSFRLIEEGMLTFWRERDIARRSVEKPAPKGNFVFYEGPPTANGRPGIHHVSARAIKDLFLRYRTMRGYRAQRRHGWDTHGLPVEVEVEKKLKLKNKRDIEAFGIARFNELCRESVFQYIEDWNRLTERIGFWLDLENGYVTYTNGYIESCWWILKELWDRGALYEGFKTTMHCPRCNSTLASHEVSQGMTEGVDDPSVWVKFRLSDEARASLAVGDGPVSLLIWTTTPWTLPANVAVAVHPEASYALVRARAWHGATDDAAEVFIVAAALVDTVFGEGRATTIRTLMGSELVGLEYLPLYDASRAEGGDTGKLWHVLADDFVTLTDGTGMVHIAPAYGDLDVGRKHDLPMLFSVDLAGEVMPEVKPRFGAGSEITGVFFKTADPIIIRDLKGAGALFRSDRVKHAYPLCWRDDVPLLFYAKSSWYIRTTDVKDQLLTNNRAINWVPDYVKEGRFGRWLETNVDWALSRERFWGTPLPIWETANGEKKVCVGSVAELSRLVGRDLSSLDLHRPFVDEITFDIDGETYRRVLRTIDVWFDSGAMPYAQWHYPFENAEVFHEHFPADFISEAMDQTRGWFYSLHALATLMTYPGSEGVKAGALADRHKPSPAFRNCVVVGFINDAQGRKMSKSRGNAVDPWTVLNAQGADALRWYLFSSGPADQNKNFDIAFVDDAVRDFVIPLWNTYNFLVTYARIDQPDLSVDTPMEARSDLDRWLAGRTQKLIKTVTEAMDAFDSTRASRALGDFVDVDVSKWYIRLNRRRVWKNGTVAEKQAAYRTLWEALSAVVRMIAPMVPFISEAIYQNLVRGVDPTAPESVHLAEWPEHVAARVDEVLLADMESIRRVVDLGRRAREDASISQRQPLAAMKLRARDAQEQAAVTRFEGLVRNELNVKAIEMLPFETDFITYTVKANFALLGKQLGKQMRSFAAAVTAMPARAIAVRVERAEPVSVTLDGVPTDFPPEAFLLNIQGPEGHKTVADGASLVALTTEITHDLLLEGRARDLVRTIQDLRKSEDLDLAARVHLGLELTGVAREAAELHRDTIAGEVLAETVTFGRLARADKTLDEDLKGEPVHIEIAWVEGT